MSNPKQLGFAIWKRNWERTYEIGNARFIFLRWSNPPSEKYVFSYLGITVELTISAKAGMYIQYLYLQLASYEPVRVQIPCLTNSFDGNTLQDPYNCPSRWGPTTPRPQYEFTRLNKHDKNGRNQRSNYLVPYTRSTRLIASITIRCETRTNWKGRKGRMQESNIALERPEDFAKIYARNMKYERRVRP